MLKQFCVWYLIKNGYEVINPETDTDFKKRVVRMDASALREALKDEAFEQRLNRIFPPLTSYFYDSEARYQRNKQLGNASLGGHVPEKQQKAEALAETIPFLTPF
jgi:hypothetical protein